MKEEIIENIFKQAQQNFARPISKEEIIPPITGFITGPCFSKINNKIKRLIR